MLHIGRIIYFRLYVLLIADRDSGSALFQVKQFFDIPNQVIWLSFFSGLWPGFFCLFFDKYNSKLLILLFLCVLFVLFTAGLCYSLKPSCPKMLI